MLCKVEPTIAQPGGILWENVHITWKTRWLRFLLQVFILLLILAGGFLIISLLNISNPPLNNENIDTTGYTVADIEASTDPKLV